MAKQYVIDCGKYPSDTKCDLKISGSNKEAVVDAAYHHAIGPMHGYKATEKDLKAKLKEGVEERETVDML